MSSSSNQHLGVRYLRAVSVPAGVLLCASNFALADEGGVAFWLTGQFGSLAAAPQQPGWSAATIYYHTSVSAGGDVAAAREATIGRFNPTVNINLNANLNSHVDLDFLSANYVFQQPVLGGQLAIGIAGAFGRNSTSIDGTLTASVGNLIATRFGSIDDSRWGVADLFPQVTLRWNQGVSNYMVYMMGDLPVGTYDSSRLANFGIGHGAIDGGAGYTYFNPQTGHEFSVVSGLTFYNFTNNSTDYQNGVDWHLDWGLSQFLSKQVHAGLVGYFYDQVTADRGAPLILGANLSRVAGIGPQIGYIVPLSKEYQGYFNIKGYTEFDESRRAAGWNLWLTFAVSPATPPATTPKRMLTK